MAKKILHGSIALSMLKSAQMTVTKKNGKKVKGIFIAYDANYIIEGKKGVYLPITEFINDEPDEYGNIAAIKQSVDSKLYKDASEQEKEEFKKLPYLANLKDLSEQQDHNSGMADEEVDQGDFEETDDLPF